MMIETATVVSYQNGIAKVQCYAKTACGGCAAQSACGSKALSALAGERFAPQFELKVDQELKAGEQIKLGLAENTLLKGVFLVYCLPLLSLILSAVVFTQFLTNELIIAAGILLVTAVTFVMIKKQIENRKNQIAFTPIFLGKV